MAPEHGQQRVSAPAANLLSNDTKGHHFDEMADDDGNCRVVLHKTDGAQRALCRNKKRPDRHGDTLTYVRVLSSSGPITTVLL